MWFLKTAYVAYVAMMADMALVELTETTSASVAISFRVMYFDSLMVLVGLGYFSFLTINA